MQIGQRIHAVKIPFSIISHSGVIIDRFVYVYLIYGINGICLIDSGVAGSEEMLAEYIRNTGRRMEDIFLIVQTHTHPDHIGATRAIKGDTGCAVAVHPEEKRWIEDVKLQAIERPIPGFDALVSGSVAVNRLLEDRETFDLGCGLKLQTFHVPGHSKGSVSILLLGYMALFTGDALPVPGGLPIYEDVVASINSIKRLKAIKDVNQICPSWDEPCKGEEVYRRFDQALLYLQNIHDAVIKISGNDLDPELTELSARVLEEIGIPPEMVNPLVEKSIASHLPLRSQKIII